MKKSYCARLSDLKSIRNQRKSASSLFRTKFAIVRWKVAQSEAKEIQSGETPVLSRGTGKQHSALFTKDRLLGEILDTMMNLSEFWLWNIGHHMNALIEREVLNMLRKRMAWYSLSDEPPERHY
ncbi:hypothetical protein E4U60_000659 [Claviceps pazoutovae]|uniref:Uncharacterized protein n=1 Tax=Claviceps pazoutovae TaxID=1649127 RepID=A0A9P7SHB5_9HYPO|nr:hypothetical protein E4U60_000659 [Claviceps pazoutovae]